MRFSVFPAALVMLVAAHAQAQSAPPSNTPRSDRVLADAPSGSESIGAKEHFERALTWYRMGKYARAVEELDLALDRDPGGKDLVFNLALVQEKLGDLEGAIRSLGRFQSLEKDPVELERAQQAIDRLRGAQAEFAANRSQSASFVAPLPAAPARVRGKLDAWVIGTGSLALASFVVGTAFGVRALTLDSRSDLSGARDAAVITDLAFATSVLAGAGCLGLYLGRYADAPAARLSMPVALPRVSAAGLLLRY
jgi:tetratricopeptide (TPR) repeat protein